MRRCLTLARQGLGRCHPNPPVGCVLVAGDLPLGSARTADGGRPHAETRALARAGARARGATAYLSLEPCDHQGATPPCTEALLRAGIRRAVVAVADPNPAVAGRGIARLRDASVAVSTGLREAEARAILAGHQARMRHGRPYVTLKIAATLDGAVATADRARTPITGRAARAYVERLRAEHDALLIGAGTVATDDPLLQAHNRGLRGRQPVRVVLDARLTAIPGSRLLQRAADAPLWVLHGHEAVPGPGAAVYVPVATAAGRLVLRDALATLGRRGIGTVFCEAGPGLAAALLQEELVDEIVWLTAGRCFGTNGLGAVGGPAEHRFQPGELRRLGDDFASHWHRAEG